LSFLARQLADLRRFFGVERETEEAVVEEWWSVRALLPGRLLAGEERESGRAGECDGGGSGSGSGGAGRKKFRPKNVEHEL